MKAVLQRVKSASVTVDGQTVSSIGRGVLVLVGVSKHDSEGDVKALAAKVVKVKMWDDPDGRPWRRSVQEVDGEVLCVSQFTLFASTKKARPDFHRSAPAATARELYSSLLTEIGRVYRPDRVKDGRFQEMMDVALVNDGPVTYIIDTEPSAGSDEQPPASTEKGNE